MAQAVKKLFPNVKFAIGPSSVRSRENAKTETVDVDKFAERIKREVKNKLK